MPHGPPRLTRISLRGHSISVNSSQPPSILKTISIVNEMRSANVIGEYAIGGAVAAFMYIEPAFTADLDIFILLKQPGMIIDLTPILGWLVKRGYAQFERKAIVIEGWAVQFIPVFNPLTENALIGAIPIDLDGTPTRIFSQEHLMAICLDTGREKDFLRLSLFRLQKGYDGEKFTEIVNQFDLAEKWAKYKTSHPET
jgi:hypothetical protein